MAEKPKADKGDAAAAPAKTGGLPIKMMIIGLVAAIVLIAASMAGMFFVLKSQGLLGGGAAPAHGGKEAAGHAAEKEKDKEKEGAAAEHGEPPAPAHYVSMEQPLIVNFTEGGKTRFLQVTIDLMTRDEKQVEEIKKHSPLIRNNVLTIFSQQPAEMLRSTLGKEQIRLAVLAEIKKVLKQETGEEIVEAVYFTSFVMQ